MEDTLPLGVTKITFTQCQFDESRDNAELMICNYYDSPIEPEIADVETELKGTATITYSGTKPTIKVGGSAKIFTPAFSDETVTVYRWTISDENGDISADTENYTIEYDGELLKLKVSTNYYLIGKILIDKNTKVSKQNVLSILKTEFFVFINSFAGIYILNAPKYAIDSFLTEDIQAIYGYIMMPATVMTLFTQFIVMPVLGNLKSLYEKKDFKAFNNLTFKIKLIVIAFGGFAVGAAYLLGPEFLGLIYGVELLAYRMNLCVIIGSYIFYAISYVNLVTLTTIRHTFVQFVIYMISIIIAFIGSNILVKKFGIDGATFSCTITLAIQFLMYSIVTKIIMYKEKKKVIS